LVLNSHKKFLEKMEKFVYSFNEGKKEMKSFWEERELILLR